MCCCQPYTRERTSHAPQTSGKRKSKNEKGLPHEVSPPTQHPVLKCLGRTVSPYHCLFPDFRRARHWDGARTKRGFVPRSLTSDTAHGTRVYWGNRSTMLHCLFRIACHSDGARARRGCTTKSLLRHGARYSSVSGEPFGHAPLPLSKSLPQGWRASKEWLSHEVSPPTQR